MEMICWASTQDRTKSCCQFMKCRQTVFQRAFKNADSRVCSTQDSVGVYDLKIHQKDMPSSYPRLKTTVQNFSNQKVRARSFEAFLNLNQKWNRGSMMCSQIHQRTEIAKYTELQSLLAENAQVIKNHSQKKSGDLITADHKILSEDCESRNNHRYAVVVQELATQWLQSHPCRTKSSQEIEKSLRNLFEPSADPKVMFSE